MYVATVLLIRHPDGKRVEYKRLVRSDSDGRLWRPPLPILEDDESYRVLSIQLEQVAEGSEPPWVIERAWVTVAEDK